MSRADKAELAQGAIPCSCLGYVQQLPERKR